MRRSYLSRAALFGAILTVATGFAPARGDFLATESTSVTALAGNLYQYSYTVTVAATSTVAASEFDVSLGAAINPASIIAPSNFFSFYTPGDPFITFTAFDTGNPFVGIGPGSSGTFSFLSTFAPVTGVFQVLGLDPSFTTAAVGGSALTPGAVPEPASAWLLGLGVCGAVVGCGARARRRSAVSLG